MMFFPVIVKIHEVDNWIKCKHYEISICTRACMKIERSKVIVNACCSSKKMIGFIRKYF